MAATTDLTYDEQFTEAVGDDATSNFETGGNYADSNPTENASSESLYAAGGLNAARKTAGVDDEDEDEDEDDDLEDEDDEDDDLEDEDDLDEDDEDEDEDDLDDEDDEDEDDDLDDEDDDDEDDDEDDDDATLKMESTDSIRGRATDSARAAARKRL